MTFSSLHAVTLAKLNKQIRKLGSSSMLTVPISAAKLVFVSMNEETKVFFTYFMFLSNVNNI